MHVSVMQHLLRETNEICQTRATLMPQQSIWDGEKRQIQIEVE